MLGFKIWNKSDKPENKNEAIILKIRQEFDEIFESLHPRSYDYNCKFSGKIEFKDTVPTYVEVSIYDPVSEIIQFVGTHLYSDYLDYHSLHYTVMCVIKEGIKGLKENIDKKFEEEMKAKFTNEKWKKTMSKIEEVTGDTVALEQYMYVLEIAEKYRKLIEDNMDTSSLDEEIYPDLPAVIVYRDGGR